MNFSELSLHKQVLAGVESAHFKECMPVQERVLPISLQGTDVMVQSKTGSGKTAVYILTFLEEYLRKRDKGIRSSCLIIAPTRELAQQISDDAQILCSGIEGFHIGCFYGGVGYEHQNKLLEMGCDIYVGTPGRLLEFAQKRMLNCASIDVFVIDEADRMFDMGFYPDITRMFRFLPPKDKRQTMLFSATLELRVRNLAWEFMQDPVEIEVEPENITVNEITQELYHVSKAEKFGLLLQLLARENPTAALIFSNSKHRTEEVSNRLKLNGYNSDYLTGDLQQNQRQRALEKIKDGETRILVATDVAARGLQIDDLPLVVNYDIPEDYENYVHRIGRTARAGKCGKSITLADEEFVYGLEAIEKYIQMKIPVIWPENLPEVEDKSLGKRWSKERIVRRPEGLGRRFEGGRRPAPRREPQADREEKKTKPKLAPSKPKTDFSKLASMTEKERMEYYKKQYMPDTPKKENKKKVVSKPIEVVPESPKAPEKKGFFSRLFGKMKGGK